MLRVGKNVFDGGLAAHRLRSQAHVGELQVLDQSGKIAGEFLRVRDADFASRGIAAMTEGHAGMAAGEMRDLLPPGQMIAAESMGKDDCGARSRHFIVDPASRSFEITTFRSGGSRTLSKGRPHKR